MTDEMNEQPVNEEATNEEATNEEEGERTPFESFLFHQRRALEETGRALDALLPEGFKEHSAEATREFTRGFRVLLEAAMEEIKNANEEAAAQAGEDGDNPSTTGPTKVRVDVE